MKITKSQLKQIIKEELYVLRERSMKNKVPGSAGDEEDVMTLAKHLAWTTLSDDSKEKLKTLAKEKMLGKPE